MLITPVPVPTTQPVPAQVHATANALPQVLTQAVAAVGHNAVTPSPRAEKGDKAKERRRQDRRDDQRAQKEPGDGRGDYVNFSV